jgi:hypothetical protein
MKRPDRLDVVKVLVAKGAEVSCEILQEAILKDDE